MPERLADTGSIGPIPLLPIGRDRDVAGHRVRSRARWLSFMLVAVLLAATFTMSAPVSAQAAPPAPTFSIAPDSGPTAGGTEVTVTPPPGVTSTSVAAGTHHSLAIGSDGTTYTGEMACSA